MVREKDKQGCCFEVIEKDGRVSIAKHVNTSCFSSANGYNNITLNIYEPKKNIDLTPEEIVEYLELLKKTGLFLDIEFIADYSEDEYKFSIVRGSNIMGSKFKGTYSAIRYLWGDGKGNNFQLVPPKFLRLVKEYPKKDIYSLLQISHIGLPLAYNTNHALVYREVKIIKGSEVKHGEDMNYAFSGTYGAKDAIVLPAADEVELIKSLEDYE